MRGYFVYIEAVYKQCSASGTAFTAYNQASVPPIPNLPLPTVYNALSADNTESLKTVKSNPYWSEFNFWQLQHYIFHEFNCQCVEMHLQRKCQLFHLDIE